MSDEKNESLDDRLARLRKMRDEMTNLLKEKVAKLKSERDEVMAQYDEQIGELENELLQLGVGVRPEAPHCDVGIKAYNFLRMNAGTWFSGSEIMRQIKSEGAIASIVLASFIERKKIIRQGEHRSTRYCAPREESSQ